MTDRDTDPALDLAARALARVLGLEAADLRADSPLGDLGADPLALVLWADVVAQEGGADAVLPDDAPLGAAETLGDLADLIRRPVGAT